jgi:hypothetical protein
MGRGKSVCDPSQYTGPNGVRFIYCAGLGFKYFAAIEKGAENDRLGESPCVISCEACALVG